MVEGAVLRVTKAVETSAMVCDDHQMEAIGNVKREDDRDELENSMRVGVESDDEIDKR